MIVSIHQPQYIPWVPYFTKIKKSNIFVFLDDVQFQKNGLQNRNYVWSKNGELRLTIPVSVNLGDVINSVKIADKNILKKHWVSLENTYKKAPFFEEISGWMKEIFFKDYVLLNDLNTDLNFAILKYLKISTPIIFSSTLEKYGEKSDLVLSICNKLSANTYITGSGGLDYLVQEDFEKSSIKIELLSNQFKNYPQINSVEFVSKLSILDLLFNVGVNSINYI